jgi:hypothetical protein
MANERRDLRLVVAWDPDRALRTLFGIAVSLLLIDVAAYMYGLTPEQRALIDLNWEGNIPTWVSTTQSLLAGVVAAGLSNLDRAAGRRRHSLVWGAIAAFFVFFSLDDASEMHEQLATLLSESMKEWQGESVAKTVFDGFRSYYWQLYFLPFFAAAGVGMLVFLHGQMGGLRGAWLFVSGLVLFAIAVYLDHLDPFDVIYDRLAEIFATTPKAAQHYCRDIEEFIEMFGSSCVLVSFADHYSRRTRGSVQESTGVREGTKMTKQTVALVVLVAVAGAVIGASLTYLKMSGDATQVQAAAAPENPKPAPKPEPAAAPLLEVAPADLSLEGFIVGAKEAQVVELAQKLRLDFQKKPDKDVVHWDYVNEKDDRYRSLRLLFSAGELVGVRVKYKTMQPDRLASWDEALKKPYRADSEEKSWETTELKAKANVDGGKYYVVRKQFRSAFEW